MKKTLTTLLLLAVLFSGCQQRGQEELEISAESGQTTILGHIAATDSRTTLASDGRTVLWAKGDTIGTFGSSSSSRNVAFALKDTYDGAEDGLFKAKGYTTPVYAYFPYKSDAAYTSNTVSLTLPSVQSPKNGQPDMRYDLKVASSLSGNKQSGYSAVFVQKLALLHFVLTPDSRLAGDEMVSITLRDTSATLSGEFTLSLNDASKPLSFTSASDMATIIFDGAPVLAEGVPVEGWLFVNPAVAKGDALDITVNTSSHSVKIQVTAAKDFEAGYRYQMPLDVAYLVSKGKATIKDKSGNAEIMNLSTPGIYDFQTKTYLCQYVPQVCQYSSAAYTGKSAFRLLSFSEGWSIETIVPQPIVEGLSCVLTVNALGDAKVKSGSYAAEITQVTDSLLRISSPDSGLGFIMLK